MIVKMKKVTMLVSTGALISSLLRLRKLGLVHIEHVRQPQARELSDIEEALITIDTVLPQLDAQAAIHDKKHPDITFCLREAASLIAEREKNAALLTELDESLEWFKVWGDFSTESVGELEKSGIYVKLYACTKREFQRLEPQYALELITQTKNAVYCALVSRDKESTLSLPSITLPTRDATTLRKEYHTLQDRRSVIEQKLRGLCVYKQDLVRHKSTLEKRREFFRVQFGMAPEEGFAYLQGFCPVLSVKSFETAARGEGWVVLFEDPLEADQAPTLLKNPRWIQIIKPVFKLMGVAPGYKEFDVSIWFLFFFSLFFALLIGDAGYGILFLLFSFFLQKKLKLTDRTPFILLRALSGTTIVWGAVTGTWFGAEQIARLPFFEYFVVDSINSFIADNRFFMMYLCLLIGTVQLTLAHSIIIVRYINSAVALAQAGWISIVWAMFFLIRLFVLEKPLPPAFGFLIAGGALLVVLFSNFQKNIIKGIGKTLGLFPLKLVNSFADILSYIRLFVVGYVSVTLAASFNAMAAGLGTRGIVASLAAACILFFGHTLNILLGLMSVLVHGLRLNMLEFSQHLDMEWSGKEYKPFCE